MQLTFSILPTVKSLKTITFSNINYFLGCSDDYALAYANANFAYTLELTPGGRFRHDFPQDRIFELVKEMLLMYREFGLFIKERFG